MARRYRSEAARSTARVGGIAAALVASLLLGACASDHPSAVAPPDATHGEELSVLYAGSLAAVMEDNIGPAFVEATGYGFSGEAHGSLGAAQLIRDGLKHPDVFVSADPAVNEDILMGEDNKNLVQWYLTFASSEMVIGYSSKSPHADRFEDAASGGEEWFDILADPSVTFGRGDPTIDPKGYRTLFMFALAAQHYGDPRIAQVLGGDLNPDQVLPEVALLARVDSGQFDAGVFYRHEAVAAGIPYVTLPAEINLGDPTLAARYAEFEYQTPEGATFAGAPILFTATIPATVSNLAAAEEFVHFLATSPRVLEDLGFGAIDLILNGDDAAAPLLIRESI